MSIKLFKASNFSYTPFNDYAAGDLEYLQRHDISFTDNPGDADVIISQNYKHFKKYFWRGLFGKKFLIWTLESRFDTHFDPKKKVLFGLAECHFMNVYTRDVFVSNITFNTHHINKKLNYLEEDFKIKSRKVVGLMSYYKGIDAPALLHNNHNIDLIALRSKIGIQGSRLQKMDVYGKGWPDGISKEDSREGDWVNRKQTLLENYNFNLCFENTAAYNYMTEKIWDSIENYCLPVYYGKHTNVYSIFPEQSFIDYSEFDSPKALFDFIDKMTDSEFVNRMNKCISVYNSVSESHEALGKSERIHMLDKIVLKLQSILKK